MREHLGHTNTTVFISITLFFSEAFHLYWCVRAFGNFTAAGIFQMVSPGDVCIGLSNIVDSMMMFE